MGVESGLSVGTSVGMRVGAGVGLAGALQEDRINRMRTLRNPRLLSGDRGMRGIVNDLIRRCGERMRPREWALMRGDVVPTGCMEVKTGTRITGTNTDSF